MLDPEGVLCIDRILWEHVFTTASLSPKPSRAAERLAKYTDAKLRGHKGISEDEVRDVSYVSGGSSTFSANPSPSLHPWFGSDGNPTRSDYGPLQAPFEQGHGKIQYSSKHVFLYQVMCMYT